MPDTTLTPTIEACVRMVKANALAVADPDERARAMQHIAQALVDMRGEITKDYALSVFLANRAGRSYTELGPMLGFNGARASQLVKQGRAVAVELIGEDVVAGLDEAKGWDADAVQSVIARRVGV